MDERREEKRNLCRVYGGGKLQTKVHIIPATDCHHVYVCTTLYELVFVHHVLYSS